MKRIVAYSLWSVMLAIPAWAAEPIPAKGEFGNHCAEGLATGQSISTDCTIQWTDSATKKVYCFSSEKAKQDFAKDTAGNVKKAAEFYQTSAEKKAQSATAPESGTAKFETPKGEAVKNTTAAEQTTAKQEAAKK